MLLPHSIWELSGIGPHGQDGSINPFHEGVGHTAWVTRFFATFVPTRSEWVIDANSSTLSPENRILSTPVSQIRKSHAAKGSPRFAEIGYPSRPTPLEYMVDTS